VSFPQVGQTGELGFLQLAVVNVEDGVLLNLDVKLQAKRVSLGARIIERMDVPGSLTVMLST